MSDESRFLTRADYDDLKRRGRRAYGAQCVLCSHSLNRGNLVIGCLRFENSKLDTDTAGVLAAMLYQAAGSAKCPGRTRLEIGPDAYRSLDLPQPEEANP